ncbi:MAG: CRISPR-associated helicase Cas3' [Legionellales bacterium]|jgi:CRISPR-associated endonuclease/helicase Cas3
MDITTLFYRYWGKADKSNYYHLLVYHSLDVAAVAQAYFDEHPQILEVFAQGLGLEKSQAKALILLFITLHDLGKFSAYFQGKVPNVFLHLNPERKLRENNSFHHDVLGDAIWRKKIYHEFKPLILNQNQLENLDIASAFKTLIGATVGHHGKPTEVGDNLDFMFKGFDPQDIEAAIAFFHECKKIFFGEDIQNVDLIQHVDEEALKNSFNRVSWWLSGVTILSDWLGSNRDYFQYQTKKMDLHDYWHDIQKHAKKAIHDNGLTQINVALNKDYQSLLNINQPRPLQQFAQSISIENGPQLFILEDMTGAGKTEAALMLAYRIMAVGAADGIYFALPTMATANGIYHRLTDPDTGIYKNFFESPQNISIILAHANRHLAKPYHECLTLDHHPDKILQNELSSATAYCNAWFNDNNKKALLANMGAGTIDQALQSVLPNRHQSLRLMGLFRKVLIIDEVHACDSYMLELLANLIVFHTASGGSTILLSATLPQKMRTSLTNAFYQALGSDPMASPATIELRYPLATYCQYGENSHITPIPAVAELCRTVNTILCDDLSVVENTIIEKLNQGLCVCWIRNTVSDAVEAYNKFSQLYPIEKITLFHSRFTMHDRYKIENKVMQQFGKNSTKNNRQGQLVIATQVVEQSLDLDFDFMVTDLAPIDLIIQRIGRLQRHIRNEERPHPMILIYAPMPIIDAAASWYSELLPKAAKVYTNHAQLWLTAKLIAENPVLDIPNHIRPFVEYVYDDENCSEKQVPNALQETSLKSEGKTYAKQEQAKTNQLKIDHGYQNQGGINWWEDAYTPTRLSEVKSIQTYLARWDGEQITPWHKVEEFAWDMSSITIPEYALNKKSACTKQTFMDALPDEFSKKRMQHVLIYDEQNSDWFYLAKQEKEWGINKVHDLEYSSCYGLIKK